MQSLPPHPIYGVAALLDLEAAFLGLEHVALDVVIELRKCEG